MKNLRKLAQVNQRLNEAIQQMTLHPAREEKKAPATTPKPEKRKPEAQQKAALIPKVVLG